MSQIHVFRGSSQIITILYGGLAKFITILHGGGSFRTPNLYYVIYGRPLRDIINGMTFNRLVLQSVPDAKNGKEYECSAPTNESNAQVKVLKSV